jgi:hypothetical protein
MSNTAAMSDTPYRLPSAVLIVKGSDFNRAEVVSEWAKAIDSMSSADRR